MGCVSIMFSPGFLQLTNTGRRAGTGNKKGLLARVTADRGLGCGSWTGGR